MKPTFVGLTGIALTTLLMMSTGCRTASSTQLEKRSKSSQLQLPAGTVVRVRMPDEGRDYQALFQAPDRYNPRSPRSNDWAGEWFNDEWSTDAILYSSGFAGVPLLLGAVAHSVGGLALYHTVGKPTPYPQDDQAREVAAMAAVSRAWDFEHDLKEGILTELRRHGLVAIDDSAPPSSSDPDTTAGGGTLDLHIVAAGMIRDQSFSKGVNPPQTLHLEVRAEVAGTDIPPFTMRVTFDSERARFREWAAAEGSRFAAVRAESIQKVATGLAGRLSTAQPALRLQSETHLALQP